MPQHVAIVDSAESTAAAVAAQLGHSNPKTQNAKLHFFATDSVDKFRKLGERFMGYSIENVQHVDIEG